MRLQSNWERWLLAFLLFLACGALALRARAAEPVFLDVDKAFHVEVAPDGVKALAIRLTAAPGYHLYRDRFAVAAQAPAVLPPAELPDGKRQFDESFGKDVVLWTGTVAVHQPLGDAPASGQAAVSYQGCADRGLCYPPQSGTIQWSRNAAGALTTQWVAGDDTTLAAPAEAPGSASAGVPAAPVVAAAPASAAAAPRAADDSGDLNALALRSGSLPRVVGLFLLGGLLLSFTPCVLPMLPILSSIIVGQGEAVSRRKGFTLALAYSLGMALVYTAAGVVAGLVGSGFAAALQNPWVLGSFALLLSGLALSMFGVWEFQMPGFIQDRINSASNQLGGGRHAAVFAMGGLSALLVGPCVAAPLAGALVYISQTRDVLLGGSALFALAMGMSVPLLLLGLSAGTLLPRAGRWMEHVKTFFGVLLLGVALWLVSPVLPIQVVMLVAGTAVLVLLFWLGAFEASRPPLLRGVGVVLALWAVSQMGGALSGGDSFLQPLRHLARNGGSSAVAAAADGPTFRRITRVDELEAALKDTTRPVVLDMAADWCVSCKEMAHLTFGAQAVRPRLERATLLQADVTANSADAKALLRRFGLFGPPAVIFFDASGRELPARTIGFEPPEVFARRLDAAKL
jgi:thiol:disulfide interchange protein DsbD